LERREFVKSALVTAGMASGTAFGAESAGKALPEARQEFYQLRTYTLRTGPQLALAQGYFEKPTYFVLIPATSAEALVTLDARLGKDTEYVKAASGFRDAPASAPAFMRAERTLLSAFAGWPKVVTPKKEKRIFQLRTYESPSQVAHARKVQMFNEAEIGIFTRAGLTPVFFGDTLIGARMPSLTYMLTFADTAELTEKWKAFSADPAWKELSHRPGNTDAEIVSNISNLYLSPLSCSQI
jgi:NIPSNAP